MSISSAQVHSDDIAKEPHRDAFPQLADDVIYLDNAGSSLHTKHQIQSFSNDIINNFYGNPHSSNSSGARCGDVIEQVRLDVMRKFNVTSRDHVIFTSGATSACQLVAEVFDGSFVYLQDNHTSVVGMREPVMTSPFGVYCLSMDRAESGDPFCLDDYDVVELSGGSGGGASGSANRHLFAYPAQSNFSGAKYPLEWIGQVQSGSAKFKRVVGGDKDEFYVFLDVASYVSTSPFNFAESRADFACLSFYKIFGFPTGLGLLIVSERAASLMTSPRRGQYFGGGSVDAYLANRDFHRPAAAAALHARYERGTVNYYDVIALRHGFESLTRVAGSMRDIQRRTFRLTQILHHEMTSLRHYNDAPLAVVYGWRRMERQGPIVAFNLRDSRSRFIGFNDVIRLATAHKIELRAGCFCNVGACVAMLRIDADVMKGIYQDGHRCGGERDVIGGLPVGAVRASLGYFSTADDVARFVDFLRDCFVEKRKPAAAAEVEEEIGGSAEVRRKVSIKKIVLFPVKSCGGVEVDEWVLRRNGGLEMDRRWMLIDEHGVCMTLKRHRKLSRIQPRISSDFRRAQLLGLSASGHGSVDFAAAEGGGRQTREVKICGDRVLVHPCNDVTVDSWLSRVLECGPVQLVRIREDGGDRLSLVNQAQYLAVTEPSLEALRDAIDDATDDDVTDDDVESLAARFRPNLVLGGAAAPFEEEKWTRLQLDDVTGFEVTGNCRRCDVICVDPRDGSRRKEMLKILKLLPPPLGGAGATRSSFGIYLRLRSESDVRLSVGSEVAVTLL